MIRTSLKAIALCTLLVSAASSQESKIKVIDWVRVRGAFEAYCQSPSVENADSVLAALPDGNGYQEVDPKEFAASFRYIFDGRPFRLLNKLVQKGDKPALRIAFRMLYFSSGCDDIVCILLGKSIRVNPISFLEEFKSAGLERAWLELIVTGFGWADEGYPELSDKEIRLRMRSLRSVDRPDLIELRDICISRLKRDLENRRH